jgi:hypothetical protein
MFQQARSKVGHTSHWHLDQIQRAAKSLYGKPLYSWWRGTMATAYVTDESFGIIPFRAERDVNFNEGDFNNSSQGLQYLCRKMGSTCPFLPVATANEKRLFADNVTNYYHDRTKKSFNFDLFASGWNSGNLKELFSSEKIQPSFKARVFRKTANQLENYFKVFQKMEVQYQHKLLQKVLLQNFGNISKVSVVIKFQTLMRKQFPLIVNFQLVLPVVMKANVSKIMKNLTKWLILIQFLVYSLICEYLQREYYYHIYLQTQFTNPVLIIIKH